MHRCWDTLCMTSLISLHCGFPLEVDLSSSLLFTISELRPLRHQKASTAFNTARRVPGGGVWLWGEGSLPDGVGIIPPWLEVHLMIDDMQMDTCHWAESVLWWNDKPDKQHVWSCHCVCTPFHDPVFQSTSRNIPGRWRVTQKSSSLKNAAGRWCVRTVTC